MGRIHLQKKELVSFGCFYIFLLPQTMLPSNDQIANQSGSFGQQKMATPFGVAEKYTRNQFQLSESLPLPKCNFGLSFGLRLLFQLNPAPQVLKVRRCVLDVAARRVPAAAGCSDLRRALNRSLAECWTLGAKVARKSGQSSKAYNLLLEAEKYSKVRLTA